MSSLSEELTAIFDADDPAVAVCYWCGGQVGTNDGMVLSVDENWSTLIEVRVRRIA